jgi:hypothetical protein
MPNADIGEIMGRSEGAIKSLYHRTLLSLRDDLIETARRKKSNSQQNINLENKNNIGSLIRGYRNKIEE